MNNVPTLMQSEEIKAPWNEKSNCTKTIEVNISQCLSTTVSIEVPEDFEDYDNEGVLKDFVKEQIILPSEVILNVSRYDWYVDDFCVTL